MDILNTPIRFFGLLAALAISVRILCLATSTSWGTWHGHPRRFLILIAPRALIVGMAWAVVLGMPHAAELLLLAVALLLFGDRSPFRRRV